MNSANAHPIAKTSFKSKRYQNTTLEDNVTTGRKRALTPECEKSKKLKTPKKQALKQKSINGHMKKTEVYLSSKIIYKMMFWSCRRIPIATRSSLILSELYFSATPLTLHTSVAIVQPETVQRKTERIAIQ